MNIYVFIYPTTSSLSSNIFKMIIMNNFLIVLLCLFFYQNMIINGSESYGYGLYFNNKV